MLRFGILGFGHHAVLRLIPAFAGSHACELRGLWRRNSEKAQENARAFGIPRVFATPTDLCASAEIDAVFVTSPDALHLEHVLLAIQHGKAVLCEKPLGMNTAQAEAMVSAAQQAGVVFGVAQNFRYNSSVQLARQWIAEGRIGKPRLAHLQFCYDAERSPREWIYDPALACGGPIGDVGVHCIDALRFLLQDEPIAVSTIARKDGLSGDVESSAIVSMELAGGAMGMVSVTTRAAYRSLFAVTGESGTILCENGLTVDQPVNLVQIQSGRVVATEPLSNTDAYSQMLDSFAKAVAREGAYLAPGEDGLINQRLLDAAYAAWRTGARQSLAR
ncbi:MAG TPA: Gfo/Idh/MocA family oxidoreductase [Acidisarcina sp.]|nr:Gfo/Idh/MocA family oxidoreductase [Acidisarcina sp.]